MNEENAECKNRGESFPISFVIHSIRLLLQTTTAALAAVVEVEEWKKWEYYVQCISLGLRRIS